VSNINETKMTAKRPTGQSNQKTVCASMRYLPFFKTLLLTFSGFSFLVWFAVVLERL
jgi:hypothetical protein